ncbi:DNA translocase FtsK [Thalassobellus suaedae]|uniref:DNA translocase FtsK n=1 Tax=Thalassobellus suaedae TaxID=3074124 RepID=A0ABY9XWK3_9FLAO|nr:DNA translocase FtsK [Flavobacteriaceae bacterium HL-DH14]
MSTHQYKNLTPDQYEELFSNFLVDSWSYSKVSSFARNEKAFEMEYIYRSPSRRSASSVAGNAYHEALDQYFSNKKEGTLLDLVDLQKIAFNDIEEVPANAWKTQKTTPSIEACILKANDLATSLINNFLAEIEVYDVKEIIEVEVYCDEFLTINGVEIMLPCHAKIDLVVETHDNKIVIIDHKSKAKYSDEKELAFSIGKQAITYVHCVKEKLGLDVAEVWFIENKYSKNRDKSPQLNCFKMVMDKDTIRLYDAMLYEPLRRMMEAVSTPDYVYLMNEDDNYVDKAELHAFWAQTMIAEVGDFDIPESKQDMITLRLKKIRDSSIATVSPSVIKNFRKNAADFIQFNLNDKDMTREQKIEHVLRTLGTIVQVQHKFEGYSNDTYLLEASSGTNLSSIHRYKLDIANALNVPSIRIKKDLFIYEDQAYLAIEIPKKRTNDLMFDPKYLVDLKIPIGLDNFKKTIVWDLNNHSTPHMLICGATGSGKSVSILSMLEYIRKANIEDIIIFDPKYEFTKYKSKGIDVFNDIDDIETMMEFLVEEMNDRIKAGVSAKKIVIFDEFADALASSAKGNDLKIYDNEIDGYYKNGNPKMKRVHVSTKKSLEENLKILGQKGRSCGFRIIAATQKVLSKSNYRRCKSKFPCASMF